MVERNGTDGWPWTAANLKGIRRNDVGNPKLVTDIGDWFFTEPGSGWEYRVQGQLDRCWDDARWIWHCRKGATFGIIDCIKLE